MRRHVRRGRELFLPVRQNDERWPEVKKNSLPGDVSDPFVFAIMEHDPRNFSDFVQTGARIDHQHRKMEVKRPEKSARQCDCPHADHQTVNVEERVAAGGEDAVDDHGADAASDHVDGENHEHSGHVIVGLFSQFHVVRHQRNRTQNHQCGKKSDQKRQNHRLVAVKFSPFEISGAEFVSDQDSGAAGDTVAEQAAGILKIIDETLQKYGSDKKHILFTQVFLKDIIRDFDDMNRVWEAWVEPGFEPARATVQAKMAKEEALVEMVVTAVRA